MDCAYPQGMMQAYCFEVWQVWVTSSSQALSKSRLTAATPQPQQCVTQVALVAPKEPFPLFTSHFPPGGFSSKPLVLIVWVGYRERKGAVPPHRTAPPSLPPAIQ